MRGRRERERGREKKRKERNRGLTTCLRKSVGNPPKLTEDCCRSVLLDNGNEARSGSEDNTFREKKKNNTTTLTGAYSTRENRMKYKHTQ